MPVAAAIPAVLGVGASVVAQKMMTPKMPAPQAPPPLPQAPTPEASADKAADITKKRKASASQSIYTSPLGAAGTADISRKTLLGV